MRHLWWSLILAALALCVPAGAAEPSETLTPIVVRVDILALTDAGAHATERGRLSSGAVDQLLRDGQATLLQTADLLATTRRDCMLLLGRKYPIVYYEARNAQFQVQYVDVGLKFVIMCKDAVGDTIDTDVAVEAGAPEGVVSTRPTGRFAQVRLFTGKARAARLHYGESLVLSRSHGPEARQWLTSIAPASTAGHLVSIVTVTRP